MSVRTVFGIAFATLLTSACEDVSQKKSETSLASGTAIPALTLLPRPAAMQPPPMAEPAANPAGGERSIRLFGRGIDRQRQTRI